MKNAVKVFAIVFLLLPFQKLRADVPPSLLKGDINGDGEVDIADVILCLRQSIGIDPVNLEKADIDDNGNVDISDVILLLRKSIDHFDIKRAIAIIDDGTGGTGALFSLEHALKVAGVPYITTQNIDLATKCSVIITSSTISSASFNREQKNALINFVENGGIIVAPEVSDSDFYSVFGISEYQRKNTRYAMTWNTETQDPVLSWFDHQNEKTISLGNPRYP
ncbi:MAG TPA: dockerin type I repeat-containing protein, partial [bacterium]|nr:dockerin type I repeat-containing protein [bacterium]